MRYGVRIRLQLSGFRDVTTMLNIKMEESVNKDRNWTLSIVVAEIFVVEGKMIVEISVNFRSFHSENTTGLSGQERSF
jgi:hypothetical protein